MSIPVLIFFVESDCGRSITSITYQVRRKKFLLKNFFSLTYTLTSCPLLLDLHFLLQRLFHLYSFFLLAHSVLCKRIYHISKSLKAWISTHVNTGFSWPSYTYLVRTPTRLAFPCTFHSKSGVFTSASLLTRCKYICHLKIHPFPALFLQG